MGDEGMMRIGRRCFVGNLAWSTSWQDLKDVFKEAGTVVYANVVRDGNGQGKGVVFYFVVLALEGDKGGYERRENCLHSTFEVIYTYLGCR